MGKAVNFAALANWKFYTSVGFWCLFTALSLSVGTIVAVKKYVPNLCVMENMKKD